MVQEDVKARLVAARDRLLRAEAAVITRASTFRHIPELAVVLDEYDVAEREVSAALEAAHADRVSRGVV